MVNANNLKSVIIVKTACYHRRHQIMLCFGEASRNSHLMFSYGRAAPRPRCRLSGALALACHVDERGGPRHLASRLDDDTAASDFAVWRSILILICLSQWYERGRGSADEIVAEMHGVSFKARPRRHFYSAVRPHFICIDGDDCCR